MNHPTPDPSNRSFTPVSVPLDSVLITAELSLRPCRPCDYEAENRALVSLAKDLASSPQSILQKLVDTALNLCQADSAGISLLENENGQEIFRWHAIAGAFARHIGESMPRDASPCGIVLERNGVQLFSYPERYFEYSVPVSPPIAEALLVPFHSAGKPVGTVWVIAHTEHRHLDSEHARILGNLSEFAAAAHQAVMLQQWTKEARGERNRTEKALHRRTERIQLLSETLAQLFNAREPDRVVRELFSKVAAHLGTDTYFNFMVNQEGDALQLHSCAGVSDEAAKSIARLEFGQAICGTVAQTRQPIAANDIQNSDYDKAALARKFGIQTYACNPLISAGKLLGTLSFASRTRTSFDEDELEFLGVISHYTAVALDRLRTAQALRESEMRYRSIVETAPVSIFEEDFTEVKRLVDELKAQGVADLGFFLDEHRDLLLEVLQRVKIVDVNDQSLDMFAARSKNDLIGSLKNILTPEALCVFRDEIVALASGARHFRSETRLRRMTGEPREVLFTVSFPEEGAPYDRVLVCLIDITERKRAEEVLRRSEEKLRQQAQELEQQLIVSGRLVSLGQITASMAHEFNNPLGIIMGFIEDLLSGASPEDSNYRSLKIIDEEAKRCARIVKDLMDYARPRTADFSPIQVADIIEKSFQLVENHLYKQKVALNKQLETDLPKIHADSQQLEQVMVNLFLNALDAMPEGGELTVRTICTPSGQQPECLVIKVTDTGHGIEPGNLTTIFQPFFTAKKRRGLGLGLSICDRIVKNHGGRIEVQSRPGAGATFNIYLPFSSQTDIKPSSFDSFRDHQK